MSFLKNHGTLERHATLLLVVSLLVVAIGGLVDTGRRVVAAYPGLAGGGRAPRSLPPGDGPGGGRGAVLRVPNEAERTR